MNQGLQYYLRRSPRITVIMGLVLFIGTQAYADVVGRLHIVVKDDDNEKPIAKASVTLHDPARLNPDIVLTTDDAGNVVSGQISARIWHITVKAPSYETKSLDQQVVADTTTDVEADLVPTTEKNVIRVTANKTTVVPTNTQTDTVRSGDFGNTFPVTAANPQSLTKLVRSAPGAAEDSDGQLHIRGEHSATSFYLDGWRLPGAFQGRVGQLLEPASIESLDFITGAYAPEYGGDTAAVLNVQLRSGPIKPFVDVRAEGGSYNTFDGGVTLGGQFGQAYGVADDSGLRARRFSYLGDFSYYATNNAIEPPQPDNQTAHNYGYSVVGFGNLTYRPNDRDTLGLVLSRNPAHTDVANRTGLPIQYAPYGQGYGYLGQLTAAQANAEGIPSQQQDGQDIWQNDINEFANLSWRRNISDSLSSILSIGIVHSGLDVLNNNPAVNLANLPSDNSIEYNPTITRNSHSIDGQGSLTYSSGRHTAKVGFSVEEENGIENYQLIPASQLALDGLYALGLTNLTPEGAPTGGTDADGNPVYTATGPSPVLTVKRTGYYDAGYVQDTWKVFKGFVANYGARLDVYQQTETPVGFASQSEFVDKVSPRLNLSYEVMPHTVLRGSYNKLFIEPPLAQGSILGTQIKPEVLDQYDLSIERQLTAGQKIKFAYYEKVIQNQIDTGLLVPGTQIGVFTSVNFNTGHVRGTELTYELTPVREYGVSAFLSWANSLAKPTGLDNTGAPVPVYNDHDQLNTISTGLGYKFVDTSTVGASVEYGSGFGSSVLPPTPANTGPRTSHTEVDVNYLSKPLVGTARLTVSVANLLNSTVMNNFDSGFSGTRFQQGRRILVGFDVKF